MITAYFSQNKFKSEMITKDNQALLRDAIWIDLLSPTKEEEAQVEKYIGLNIPTFEEMQEIELSSRLYKEDGVIFMTATMISKSDTFEPKNDAVTLILTGNKLITVRYIEPQAIAMFVSRLTKLPTDNISAIDLVIELLDAAIDRLADILEAIGRRLDKYSVTIFRSKDNEHTAGKLDYRKHLQELGINGDLSTKARESLVTFNRLITFFGHVFSSQLDAEKLLRLTSLKKDVEALSDHDSFLSNKVNFLLDATLGMINIEQNNTIKIFSIAAVIFLPPTLIASIYGMNFNFMPELSWHYGYPFAIVSILISAWLPYKYFKLKKWL